jgi:hypothetical protein
MMRRASASTRSPTRPAACTGRGFSDGSPYSVVPESPDAGRRVPHQLGPRRPRRRRRLRRRPSRRRSPGSPARRTTLGRRTLPVVAVVPVPLVDVAPARVPWIAWAPVIAGRRRGRRPCPGIGPGQSQGRRQSQHATRQQARRPPNPESRSLHGRHLPRISLELESRQVVISAQCVRAMTSVAQNRNRI